MKWLKKARTRKFETALSRVNDVASVTAGMRQSPHKTTSNCTQLTVIVSNQSKEISNSGNTRNTDNCFTDNADGPIASPKKRAEYHSKEDSLTSNGSLTKFQRVEGETENARQQVKTSTTMFIPSELF